MAARFRAAVGIAFLFVFVGACGGGGDEAASASDNDYCVDLAANFYTVGEKSVELFEHVGGSPTVDQEWLDEANLLLTVLETSAVNLKNLDAPGDAEHIQEQVIFIANELTYAVDLIAGGMEGAHTNIIQDGFGTLNQTAALMNQLTSGDYQDYCEDR